MTHDPGTTGGARPSDRPNRNPDAGPKLAWWRRALAWLVGKVPEPRSDRFGG